ncbi:MAG: acyltransferase family protein [Treponemataceae bacterium]
MNTLLQKQERQSEFELLRIIMMLFIIMHHYCVNSGITQLFDFNKINFNLILIQFMSIGGKVGVNVFFILSGYFMINKNFKWEKVIKLFSELIFYNLIITFMLILLGFEYNFSSILKSIFPINEIPESFICSYVMLYLISPLLNAGAKSISKKIYLTIICILLIYFSIFETFLNIKTWSYFGWAMTMYLVGGFIKLNEISFSKKQLPYIFVIMISIIFIWLSIIIFDFNIFSKISERFTSKYWHYMIGKANMFFMFTYAFGLFMIFKNLSIKQNKIINTFASTSFGVLIIHTQSDYMRQLIWKDFLKILDFYNSKYLFLHMIVSVLIVYLTCAAIDMLRIRFLEKKFFNKIFKKQ